jgi:Acetate kinase
MGTRAGDLDPAILTHLVHEGMSAQELDQMLNHEAGLLALAGTADVREILRRDDPAAQLALDIFCYRIRKYLGAYLAAWMGRRPSSSPAGSERTPPRFGGACAKGSSGRD